MVIVTVLFASAVPLNVGWFTIKIAAFAGVKRTGAFGAAVSIVTCKPDEATPVLPALSVAFAVSVCDPSLNADDVIDQLPLPSAVAVPSTVVPSVSNKVTVALASQVPVMTGVVILVMRSLLELPESLAVAKATPVGALGADWSST